MPHKTISPNNRLGPYLHPHLGGNSQFELQNLSPDGFGAPSEMGAGSLHLISEVEKAVGIHGSEVVGVSSQHSLNRSKNKSHSRNNNNPTFPTTLER